MHTFFCVSLICGMWLMSAAAARGATALVEQGKAVGRIVVPVKATKAETFAAQQIQTFIEKMSGAKLAIVSSDKAGSGPAILIGNQSGNQPVIDELNKNHGDTIDAFAVVGKAGHLSLVGRSDTSTLWAAWQWLNDQGVVWVMPGPHGTFVPHKTSIEIGDIHDIETPGLEMRGGNYSLRGDAPEGYDTKLDGVPAWKLFALRMRINENTAFEKKDRFVVLGSGHSYEYYLPPSRYFAQHPDWYSMVNGKRQHGKGWQVNFTSEAAAAEFAKNVEAQIKSWLDRGVPMNRIHASISPNDGLIKANAPSDKKLMDKHRTYSSLVTNFCNLVTADIRKVYPKAMTKFYAYANYSMPPEHIKPGPGVTPEIVFWTASVSFGANKAHPMFSQKNHKYRDGYRGWQKVSPEVTAHTYYGHYNWFTPWPVITQMAHDIPILGADPKCQGMYSELHAHWGTQALNLWLYPKLMWNPKLDVQAAIKKYCQAAYGPAGESIRSYYQTVQDSMDRRGYINGRVVEIPNVLTPDVIEKVNGYIAQAEGMLGQMDPDTRWRTDLVCKAWHASAKFADAVRLYNHGQGEADREKILSLCTQVNDFAKSPQGMWAFAYHRVAERSINLVTKGLKLDLTAMPAGQHRFSNRFNMGGALKFFANIKGFRSGLWGYSLSPKAEGQLDLPLKAQKGHHIVHAKVLWQIHAPEHLAGTLSMVTDNGEVHVISKDVKQMTKGIVLPPDALSGTLRLKLHLLKQQDEDVALTGCRIDVTVE